MKETPSQTAGPYLHIGLAPAAAGIDGIAALGSQIVPDDGKGERIRVTGNVRDGADAPVSDILIEVWQADAEGRHAGSGAVGWGRVVPDFATGEFAFDSIKPGALTGAPHLTFWLIARGINLGLTTRMYFAGDRANDTDPVLQSIPQARRDTLIARRTGTGYRFDIILQGADETVFFDV